jgi:hypothetical protein
MLNQIRHDIDTNMMPLIGGIIEDSKLLLLQELALIKSELKEQSEKARTIAFGLVLGAGLTLTGGVLFGVGCVRMISSFFPNLPLWLCFGAMGMFLGALELTIIHTSSHMRKEPRSLTRLEPTL